MCRKGQKGIQDKITYKSDGEWKKLLSICITAINGDDKTTLHEDTSDDCDSKTHEVSLTDYAAKDRLKIRLKTSYIPNMNNFHIWRMTIPTYKVDLSIIAPDGYQIQIHPFSPDKDCWIVRSKHSQNIVTATVRSWILPSNGFAFCVEEPNQISAEDASDLPTTISAADNDNSTSVADISCGT